eukprot:m.232918 g.232918  ORF g.232918 m.232918 type:complete len:375 (+) comp15728_c0_seq2:188-1312(+)
MGWASKSREEVELGNFVAGGPRYPGSSQTVNRALLHGEKKSLTSTTTDIVWKAVIRMRRQKWFAFLSLGALNVSLLVGGAFAMQHFEAGAEQLRNAAYSTLMSEMNQFYHNCSQPPYSYAWNVSNCTDMVAMHKHYHDIEYALTFDGDYGNKTRWTTSGSLLYSASVMTTVGYGYLFPVTTGGKVFTICFGCIAIPTTWGWMGFIGNMWIDACVWLNRKTFVRCGILSAKETPKQRYTVLWMTIVVVGYICAMGEVYMHMPDKNDPTSRQPRGYFENIYFAFVTFTTIGFGHYYIGDSSIGDTSLVLLALFSGVAVLSGFIAIVWQTISKILVKADTYIVVHEHDEEDDDMLVLHTADPDSAEAYGSSGFHIYE